VYREFINIGRVYSVARCESPLPSSNTSEMIQALIDAINKLHTNHKSTLGYLMHHLRRITDRQQENSMTAHSMGIIFAPTIFRPR